MPSTDVTFGITRHSGALIDSVETTKSIQVKELVGSDGEVARIKTYKSMTEGSVKGHGSVTIAPGVGDAGVDGVSGGVTVVTELKETDHNEDFNEWEYNFKNYPNATAA